MMYGQHGGSVGVSPAGRVAGGAFAVVRSGSAIPHFSELNVRSHAEPLKLLWTPFTFVDV